jgi:multiple sugar transport system substrate-binding protein
MLKHHSRIFLALILACLITANTALPTHAQSNAYVKTFDLPTKPTLDGAYAGVDPAKAQVVYWHPHSGSRGKTIKSLVDKFNKENPWKIKIKQVYQKTLYQSALKSIGKPTLPTLVMAFQNQAADFQNQSALIDLDTIVNDPVYGIGDDLKADFFEAFLAADINPQFDNARLGFPAYRSMESLYYNVDALTQLGYSAPPKTWDEFKEMACKWTKSGEGRIGYQVRTDASFIAAAAFGQGGDIYDSTTKKYMYSSDAVKAAPLIMQSMIKDGCAAPVAKAFADQDDFAAQKSLFYIGTSSGITFVQASIDKNAKKTKQSFKFDIAPLPYKDKPVQNVYGASLSIFKGTPAQELAAWLFIRWYTEPEQQTAWVSATAYFPVRRSTAKTLDKTFADYPAYKSAFDLLDSATSEPSVSGYDAVRNMASDAFELVLNGESVDMVFDKLNDDANATLSAGK